MRDIRAQQDRHSIILDQHTAILRQIQQHLGLAPPQTNIPGPSEPRAPTEETIPAEKTITADVPPQATHERAPEPSCPPENPALRSFLYIVFTQYFQLILYILGLDVLHDHFIVLSQSNIYISFLFILGIFYILYSLIFCFLNHVVSPIRLRIHVTKEVPLPSFIYNRSCHIEGNVDLGWRESKGRKLLKEVVNNAKLSC